MGAHPSSLREDANPSIQLLVSDKVTPWASLPLLSGDTARTAKDVGSLVDSLTHMDDIYLVGYNVNMRTVL